MSNSMGGSIFLLRDGEPLKRLQESPYDTEDLLQKLLADFPDLLSGEQIDSEQPRRWLLISREMPVPEEVEGSGRWSLDHLFLDQDAVPTLVEVKRSSDLRIRREVVGQMLDYAANAVTHWTAESICRRYEQTIAAQGRDPAMVLKEFLGETADDESFWHKVKTNLQAGRVRLLFVADEIPRELRRIIEFLNEQMDPAEVLAIEVKQYTGAENVKMLVPRLIGQTTVAQQRKTGGSPKQQKIDERSFLDDLAARCDASECEAVRRIIDWSKRQQLAPNFNRWPKTSSFIPILDTSDGPRYPISVQSQGDIWIQMRWLRENSAFRSEALREELRLRLNGIGGLTVAPEKMTGYPRVPLRVLASEAAADEFLKVLDWLVQIVRTSPATDDNTSTL